MLDAFAAHGAVQLTKFAFIQPDLQYVIRPNGTGRIPDALVIGAEFGFTF